jgi:hypothetical protein
MALNRQPAIDYKKLHSTAQFMVGMMAAGLTNKTSNDQKFSFDTISSLNTDHQTLVDIIKAESRAASYRDAIVNNPPQVTTIKQEIISKLALLEEAANRLSRTEATAKLEMKAYFEKEFAKNNQSIDHFDSAQANFTVLVDEYINELIKHKESINNSSNQPLSDGQKLNIKEALDKKYNNLHHLSSQNEKLRSQLEHRLAKLSTSIEKNIPSSMLPTTSAMPRPQLGS